MKRKDITKNQEIFLWGKAAGRCEYCNRILYRDEFTCQYVNFAEKAHIVANSKDGPRGDDKLSEQLKDNPDNFMLLCNVCHSRIDKLIEEHGVARLREIKKRHEERIKITTSIKEDKRTKIVIFSAPIYSYATEITLDDVSMAVIRNEFYPHDQDTCINLSVDTELQDDKKEYWNNVTKELVRNFKSRILSQESKTQINHFSLFGLAPIPLLVKLGTLFGELIPCEVYQLQRKTRRWEWCKSSIPLGFKVDENIKHPNAEEVALKISVSGTITDDDVKKIIGDNTDIWHLYCAEPKYDNVEAKTHIDEFKTIARELVPRLLSEYKNLKRILIFPAIPVSIAIEFGRIIPRKFSPSLEIYDRNKKRKGFFKTITITT